jgi:hypothetical protein
LFSSEHSDPIGHPLAAMSSRWAIQACASALSRERGLECLSSESSSWRSPSARASITDVPERHAGRVRDLGEGRAVHAVSVHRAQRGGPQAEGWAVLDLLAAADGRHRRQVGGAAHQALPLAFDGPRY